MWRSCCWNVLNGPVVVDVDSVDLANDLLFFGNVMTTLERCSPDASVFVLVHKMDLVGEDDREQTFLDREAIIQSKTAQYVAAFLMHSQSPLPFPVF